jgi:adenylate kinase
MPNGIVFVCGSPGAGKSTIVNRLAKNRNYRVLNVGTLMMEIAIKKKYVKDRDQLRFLGSKRLLQLQKETFSKVSGMKGNIILDTHATVEQNGRYVPGISINAARNLGGLAGLIYIDALTEDILKRRKSDRTRRRENERPELIDIQRPINISILSACSVFFNIPLYVVFNEQGRLESSVAQMRKHLKNIFGA